MIFDEDFLKFVAKKNAPNDRPILNDEATNIIPRELITELLLKLGIIINKQL